jgi:hypothetical protein
VIPSQKTLTRLHHFFTSFPSLTTLTIEGFLFAYSSQTPCTGDSLSRLSPFEILLQQPLVAAFILVVKETSVLEVRFRAVDEKREMRWKRTSRENDFEGEGWTLE